MSIADLDFRREKRVAFATKASLATHSAGAQIVKDASTIDLSESGARVRFSGPLQPGDAVELYLSTRPEPCRVVWTSPGKAPNELIVGLHFTSPLPDERPKPAAP